VWEELSELASASEGEVKQGLEAAAVLDTDFAKWLSTARGRGFTLLGLSK